MNTDERRAREVVRLRAARAIRSISAEVAWQQSSINMRADARIIARAIRASDEAALGLRQDQLQPDGDSPGLYIQYSSAEQRRQIIEMITAATEADNG